MFYKAFAAAFRLSGQYVLCLQPISAKGPEGSFFALFKDPKEQMLSAFLSSRIKDLI